MSSVLIRNARVYVDRGHFEEALLSVSAPSDRMNLLRLRRLLTLKSTTPAVVWLFPASMIRTNICSTRALHSLTFVCRMHPALPM